MFPKTSWAWFSIFMRFRVLRPSSQFHLLKFILSYRLPVELGCQLTQDRPDHLRFRSKLSDRSSSTWDGSWGRWSERRSCCTCQCRSLSSQKASPVELAQLVAEVEEEPVDNLKCWMSISNVSNVSITIL